VIPHLDGRLAESDPKVFIGSSDNTNLSNWLWSRGIASFYGGATQVHLGPGPHVDQIHLASLCAALIDGARSR
jgi:muramoyltetrapeptide carboxypeptidase LdcA involved in peptidoglycan recycling